jgi:hypothetical protein
MMTALFKRITLFLAAAMLAVGWNSFAELIYDNSAASSDLTNRFNPGLFEIGDEIVLGSPERYLTSFAFEYWALNDGGTSGSFNGIDARVRFYLNDGPLFNGYATPGTVFYDSGWLDSVITSPTNRATLNFNQSDFATGWLGGPVALMPVTSNFTWSVQFRDMDADDTVGVDLFDPPTVGQAINDYWQYNGTSWSLLTNTVPMNFAARFDAVVPEPSGVVLAVLGGLGLIWVGRRHRKL